MLIVVSKIGKLKKILKSRWLCPPSPTETKKILKFIVTSCQIVKKMFLKNYIFGKFSKEASRTTPYPGVNGIPTP